MIFLAKGTYRLGRSRVDRDGNVIEQIAGKFEWDPNGGSVAVGVLDDESMEQIGTAELFGDFDPAGYLARALELLAPTRQGNIPCFEGIVKRMHIEYGGGCPLLDYCQGEICRDCVVQRWMEEVDEEE